MLECPQILLMRDITEAVLKCFRVFAKLSLGQPGISPLCTQAAMCRNTADLASPRAALTFLTILRFVFHNTAEALLGCYSSYLSKEKYVCVFSVKTLLLDRSQDPRNVKTVRFPLLTGSNVRRQRCQCAVSGGWRLAPL